MSPSVRIPSSSSLGVERAALHAAQARAAALFRAIEEKRLVRPGESEESVSRAIFELAASDFGVEKYWHRRVIRSGPHTRMLFRELPPDDAGHADAPIPAQVPRTCLYGGQQAAPRQAASSVQAELGAMPGAVAKRSKSMLAPSVSTARRRAGARGRSGLVASYGRCRM